MEGGNQPSSSIDRIDDFCQVHCESQNMLQACSNLFVLSLLYPCGKKTKKPRSIVRRGLSGMNKQEPKNSLQAHYEQMLWCRNQLFESLCRTLSALPFLKICLEREKFIMGIFGLSSNIYKKDQLSTSLLSRT